MVKDEKAKIAFYSHWLPNLAPGEYSVRVKPTLTADLTRKKQNGEEETQQGVFLPTLDTRETFYVGGPRFALTGSEAYSCYPAPDEIGRFSDTLPHIVFDRCTLPWERSLDGSDPTADGLKSRHDPWLALILLSDSDFANGPASGGGLPKIVLGKVKDVLGETRTDKEVIAPEVTFSPLEESGLCQTIDLPENVFKRIMPRLNDLQYLVHVRKVGTNNKETWSLLKEGSFSVVICNRFPETQAENKAKDWGVVNTVCLVSLEGWAMKLEELDGLKTGKSYRLVVLGSWHFTCQGSSDFKIRMKELNDICLLGQRSKVQEKQPARTPKQYLNRALARGFIPVNHRLRNGDTTISWYRGPLLPIYYERSASYKDISSSDRALRYDGASGMLDASFAAAWQLGRLLALQDQAFAQALHRFRTDYQRSIRRTNADKGEAELDKKLRGLWENLGMSGSMRDWYVQQLREAKLLDDKAPAPTGDSAASDSEPPKFPITVENWLGQAMLLYGVPFQYLVPDEKMLPRESIRFFYLNPEWIECLLQGACSVGRRQETDELAEQRLRASFFEVSEILACKLRSDAKQAAERRREGQVKETSEQPTLHWPLSGYLLRSTVVESWIGLESVAQGVDQANKQLGELQILRMDRLAPDVLLCIYNGKVTQIEIEQPSEAVHFGTTSEASLNGKERRRMKTVLREIDSTGTTWKGKNATVEIPMRGERVIEVDILATRINGALKAAGQLTSAQFALQMIESPTKVTFAQR
jgi:hypothetical protein